VLVRGWWRWDVARQLGCAGLQRVTQPPKAPGTRRSPTDSPELHIGAKAAGNALFPGSP